MDYYLCHLFSVCFGIHRSLSAEYRVFFGGDTELVVEGMMPDLLHIVPVCDDTVFDRVIEL